MLQVLKVKKTAVMDRLFLPMSLAFLMMITMDMAIYIKFEMSAIELIVIIYSLPFF